MEFKELWDLESAMKVLAHDTVDSKLWAEAVEWLIINGPPEIQQLLLSASNSATQTSFPGLEPSSYTMDGRPCYNITSLASTLGMSEEEVHRILQEKSREHQIDYLLEGDDGAVH
jgi:hypothetical protein